MRSRRGFTLVELIVVIAVIGILATVCVPALTGQIRAGQLRTDKETAQLLTNACKRASMENSLNAGSVEYTPITLIYDPTGNTLDVFTLADISVATATPKTPGGAFIYNSVTRQMKLLQEGDAVPAGFVVFIDDSGDIKNSAL